MRYKATISVVAGGVSYAEGDELVGVRESTLACMLRCGQAAPIDEMEAVPVQQPIIESASVGIPSKQEYRRAGKSSASRKNLSPDIESGNVFNSSIDGN